MESPVIFEVFGIPVPQGSKNIYRGRLVEAQGAKLKIWREEVKLAAASHFSEPLAGPIKLEVTFWMPRPKTVKRDLPTVPPDADKLLRGVNDALSGTAFIDDAQVVDCLLLKRYADERMPGATVRISQLY